MSNAALAGAALPVARAEGVFRLGALLTGQRLIHQEEKRPSGLALHLQQLAAQHRRGRQAAPELASQKAAHLGLACTQADRQNFP